jgi:hypothetical protein
MYLRAIAAAAAGLLVACGAPADQPGTVAIPQTGAQSRLVALETAVEHRFLVAEKGGGGVVNANRAVARSWESFTLVDLDGGELGDGDSFQLAAFNGQFVSAVDGGGGAVLADRDSVGPWETFRAHRVGDELHIRTVGGQYLEALNGGGGSVLATAQQPTAWSAFLLALPAQ